MGRRQKKAAQQRKREAVEQQRKRKAEELAARENAAIAEAVRELESYLEGQNIRIEFGDELSEAHLKMLLGLDLKALAQALRAADAAAATTAADELLRQLRSRMLSEQEHVQQREAQRAAHGTDGLRLIENFQQLVGPEADALNNEIRATVTQLRRARQVILEKTRSQEFTDECEEVASQISVVNPLLVQVQTSSSEENLHQLQEALEMLEWVLEIRDQAYAEAESAEQDFRAAQAKLQMSLKNKATALRARILGCVAVWRSAGMDLWKKSGTRETEVIPPLKLDRLIGEFMQLPKLPMLQNFDLEAARDTLASARKEHEEAAQGLFSHVFDDQGRRLSRKTQLRWMMMLAYYAILDELKEERPQYIGKTARAIARDCLAAGEWIKEEEISAAVNASREDRSNKALFVCTQRVIGKRKYWLYKFTPQGRKLVRTHLLPNLESPAQVIIQLRTTFKEVQAANRIARRTRKVVPLQEASDPENSED